MIEARCMIDLQYAQAMAVLHGTAPTGGVPVARRTRLVCRLAPAARSSSCALSPGRDASTGGVVEPHSSTRPLLRSAQRRVAERILRNPIAIPSIELAAMGLPSKDSRSAGRSRDHMGDRLMTNPMRPVPKLALLLFTNGRSLRRLLALTIVRSV